MQSAVKTSFRLLIVFLLACVVSYYFSMSEKFWIPAAALFVMQSPVGSAVRHGLERFFLLLIVVIVISFIPDMPHTFYMRAADVIVGSVLGIAGNILIFPVRIDIEFRKQTVEILQACSQCLLAIEDLAILKKPTDMQRLKLEKIFRKSFPDWVYVSGFSISFRQGHRHFLVMVDKLVQIIFAMLYSAKYPLENSMLEAPLRNVILPANKMLKDIIQVLELKPLAEGVEDFEEEITILDNVFKSMTPHIELIESSDSFLYFAALIDQLKELRLTLLKFLEALA